MTQHEYAVILLRSTNHAVRAEKLLRDKGIPCKLIPVPRHISSECGVCVRILAPDADAARCVVSAAHVDIESIRAV
jgi:hypothetical protein